MRQARAQKKNPHQVYSTKTSCIAIMAKKLFVAAFFSLLVILEMTVSFPLFRYHVDQSKLESGAESKKPQDQSITEAFEQGKRDVLLMLARIQRSAKPASGHDVPRHKHPGHGLSHLHLSKDQSKTSKSANRKSPKFIAISIFLGCLAFMSLAFAITCCVHRRKQSERVKKATEVDVRPREDIPDQVSKIENAHVDVGSY